MAFSILISTEAIAAPVSEPMVWNYNEGYEAWVPEVVVTIMEHIPVSTIQAFNDHGGQVVISSKKCDQLGKAGLTSGVPTASGWYTWDTKTYMDLTPSHGIGLVKSTVLHEFGHVFDMQTGATDNASVVEMLKAELPMYDALEASTGYLIPASLDEHELFAQIFSAVVSRNDGTVPYSEKMIEACPNTASYIQGILARY